MKLEERVERLTNLYGELVTKKKAASILSCSRPIVYRLCRTGMLRVIGRKVSTESIAEYLEGRI